MIGCLRLGFVKSQTFSLFSSRELFSWDNGQILGSFWFLALNDDERTFIAMMVSHIDEGCF